jgi:GTP-binding protein
MIPADSDDFKKDYEILLGELRQFNPQLLVKERVLAITKCDMIDETMKQEMLPSLPEGVPTVFISSIEGSGLKELKDLLWTALHK